MKTSKKVLSASLATLLLALTFVFCLAVPAAAEEGTSYRVGDVIEYGLYPQTQIKDEAMIANLRSYVGHMPYTTLASYNYKYDENKTLNMTYRDFYYQNEKYREVRIGQYRPITMDWDAKAENSYQDDNGFSLGIQYFFKYEPLRWTVLDPKYGVVLCNTVIDAQPFHSKNNGNYPYSDSTIKTWLKDEFCKIAFYDDSNFNSDIFLLKESDLFPRYNNSYEGIYEYRLKAGFYSITWDCGITDYARAQNMGDNNTTGWWTSEVCECSPYFDNGTWDDVWSNIADTDWTPRVYEGQPYYFKTNNGEYREAIRRAVFHDGNSKIEDDIFDRRSLYEESLTDRPDFGLLLPSIYLKKSYNWWQARTKDFPVGNYKTIKGVRPVLRLKQIKNDARDNGYLYSAGSYASPVEFADMGGRGTATGAGMYMPGDTVRVTATPNSGYSFNGWYLLNDDGWTKVSGSATYTFTAEARGYGLEARFFKNSNVDLMIRGNGSGTMTCSKTTMGVGETAYFSAYPDKYSYFDGWYGALKNSSGWYDGVYNWLSDRQEGASLTLEATNEGFYAYFRKATLIDKISIAGRPTMGRPVSNFGTSKFTLTDGADDFTIKSVSWFEVSDDGTSTAMASTDRFTRGHNYKVALYLTKTSGKDHKLNPDGVDCRMNGDPNCTQPTFVGSSYVINYTYWNLQQYIATLTSIGGGSGQVGPAESIIQTPGWEITLNATPDEGSHFAGWYCRYDGETPTVQDECVSNNANTTFVMPGSDVTLAARFEKDAGNCTVILATDGDGSVDGGGTFAPETLITLTATAAEGSTFTGWYVNGALFSEDAVYENFEVPSMESVTLAAKFEKNAPTDPDPGTDDPTPTEPENVCPWCGGQHEGFFQGIIGFFHRIFAKIFGAKY